MNVYVITNVTYPQFYHDFITMRGAMPTHWERTHTITLNTTPVPPWKIFIIIMTHIYIYLHSKVIRTTASIIINC